MRLWTPDFDQTNELLEQFGSPLQVYDGDYIVEQARRFKDAMGSMGGQAVLNFFAVKATPNLAIMKLLRGQGMGFDASSEPEVLMTQMVGPSEGSVIFTSNNTQPHEFESAMKAGAILNFDDLTLVERFCEGREPNDFPDIAFCRYNPGNIKFDTEHNPIGDPRYAKFGMPKNQMIEAYRMLRDCGVKRFGLHTMLLSNELDHENHLRIAGLMFETAKEVAQELGIEFEAINLGGGFGVAYRPGQTDFDIEAYGRELRSLYDRSDMKLAGSPRIYTENGRWVTAHAGYLLTRVVNRMSKHKEFVGVDATMANLMRPGMYGAYHHILNLGRNSTEKTEVVDVVGSLCENNDKFATGRELPVARVGDIAVLHTTGAHGTAMGFNYNGKLACAEVMILGGEPVLIKRAQTVEDYLRTQLDLQG